MIGCLQDLHTAKTLKALRNGTCGSANPATCNLFQVVSFVLFPMNGLVSCAKLQETRDSLVLFNFDLAGNCSKLPSSSLPLAKDGYSISNLYFRITERDKQADGIFSL